MTLSNQGKIWEYLMITNFSNLRYCLSIDHVCEKLGIDTDEITFESFKAAFDSCNESDIYNAIESDIVEYEESKVCAW